jgi:DNA-binding LytR/AlgR family response regulator
LGPLAGVKESIQWLAENPAPDLILADIQLSDGISLDIFAQCKVASPVIFTTAYNEYAIRAFKVNSIDYLLKPVEKSELQGAFQKFHQLQAKYGNPAYLNQIREVFSNFNQGEKYKERFAVHAGRSVVLLTLTDLLFFVKEEIIYLVNNVGKKFVTDYRSLDEIEEIVDPGLFFRANRQCLVLLHAIEGFRSDDTGKVSVKIKGNYFSDIIVSKEKAAAFRKWAEH